MRFQNKLHLGRQWFSFTLSMLLLLLVSSSLLNANPTGGQVAGGAATINTKSGSVTVKQLSNQAVINWQTFSIGSGQSTTFLQPSVNSAVLNRVLGGNTSVINGALNANGQVYLLNGNGVIVGPKGVINAGGFTASTRNLSDSDFYKKHLQYLGKSNGSVTNYGKVNALGGDAVLIGKTVNNQGTISATGNVDLAAGNNVTISQKGMDNVYVRNSAGATGNSRGTAINNSGTIDAANAQLEAANGNLYALAINNSGTIRATGLVSSGGRLYLRAAGNLGTVENTGSLFAQSSHGFGGHIDTSGGSVIAHGVIDAGPGGSWLIDPSDITIDAPTATTIEAALNAGTNTTEDSSVGTGGAGNITVTAPVTWTSTATLSLDAYNNLNIGSAITANTGTLDIKIGTGGSGTGTSTANIAVGTFNLQGGAWSQNVATLPTFTANNFTISGGGSFLRVMGGTGTTAAPYQIIDAYGLQGIGSSTAYEAADWRVATAFNAATTATWNGGAGFVPIANFTGAFNGNGDAISNLKINLPAATNVGLFAQIASTGSVIQTILTTATITGDVNVGTIAGTNIGLINTSNATGTVTGQNAVGSTGIGGLAGDNTGSVTNSFSNVTVKGADQVGGVVGVNSGIIDSSYSQGAINSYNNGAVTGSDFGGVVGYNNGGTLSLSYATGSIAAADSNNVGGVVGDNKGTVMAGYLSGASVTGSSDVGGFVGTNEAAGTITQGQVKDTGGNVAILGSTAVGGFAGNNAGMITSSSSIITTNMGSVTGRKNLGVNSTEVGGFVGLNSGTISSSFSQYSVSQAVVATAGTQYGGFAGNNTATGTLTSISASGNVAALTQVGGLVGINAGTLGLQSNATGTVTGAANADQVGGLVGDNTGSIGSESYATGNVSGTTQVGGLIGVNTAPGVTFSGIYSKGTVTGVTNVGGLVGNNKGGKFSGDTSSGAVTGTGAGMNIGGLIGNNVDVVTTSTSSSTVSAATSSNVGGLVGLNSGTVNTQSSASGNVTGASSVGGLVGNNTGIVGDPIATVEFQTSYTTASGAVAGTTNVGGLVGVNTGMVQQTTSSSTVTGTTTSTGIGGLVGENGTGGLITTSFGSGTVLGNGSMTLNAANTDSGIGGLAGINLGTLTLTFATGTVYGDSQVGGLVGLNDLNAAVIQESYSQNTVNGLTNVGGLLGQNLLGMLTQSYAATVVAGGAGSIHVGGLVGDNRATISETYSTGTVTGGSFVGGSVGFNEGAGTLTQSYATGATTGGASTGGLVGSNTSTVTSSYWDMDSTGLGAVGIGTGTTTGATGLTSTGATPNAFNSSAYAGFGTSSAVAAGASNAVQINDGAKTAWYELNSDATDGGTRPYLAWEAPINNPTVGGAHLVNTAHQLQLVAVSLGSSFVLGQTIDLTEANQGSGLWNPTTGFQPIGNGTKEFTGTFSGGGYGIANLYINNPTATDVGLFGANNGSISASVSGNVTGLNDVGILVGLNDTAGTVSNISIDGTATGTSLVGGAVGSNKGSITSFKVNPGSAVSGTTFVGGLTGSNTGTVQDGYSTANVTGTGAGQMDTGGLIGQNSSTVTTTYATGTVSTTGGTNIGGSIGSNTGGTVSISYATGATTGGTSVGGFVGSISGGTANQTYATGAVNGTTDIGGYAGSVTTGATVERSYASGVTTGTTAVGGIFGKVDATSHYSNVYWDHTKSALSIGSDLSTGNGPIVDVNGDTINANTATYAGLSSGTGFTSGYEGSPLIYGSGDNSWRANFGTEFPLLTQLSTQVSGTAYSDAAHTTPANGATITLNSGTNLLSTTTANASGSYAFLFSADNGLFNYIPKTGSTLRINDSADKADSIAATLYNGNGVPNLLADVEPADTWADTVRVVTSGLNNTLLASSGSMFVTTPTANSFGGTNVQVSENFEIAPNIGSYGINGNVTAQGNFTVDSSASTPGGYNGTSTLYAEATAGNPTPTFTIDMITPGDGLSSNNLGRPIVVQTDGTFVNNDGSNAIATPNGTWSVYSQNPEGAPTMINDSPGGLDQYHLYGTNPLQTPAYLLSPNLNYQIYSYTPTLTLTAIGVYNPAVTGESTSGSTLTVPYGTATPTLDYTVTGLVNGDTATAGMTFNQTLSNQPGEQTTYAMFSQVGSYPVTFIPSTEPTSLIGYKIVYASGNINVVPDQVNGMIDVTGNQTFAYQNGGTPAYTYTGAIAGDPNLTFATTTGQFTAVGTYSGTISSPGLSNYGNYTLVDNGYTVKPAAITISATGTSIYGNTISTPTFTSNIPIYNTSGNTVAVNTVVTSPQYNAAAPTISSTNPTLIGQTTNVGNSYYIGVTGPGGTGMAGAFSNYNVTVAPGTYSITPRTVTVDASAEDTLVYDASANPTTFGNAFYTIEPYVMGGNTGLVNGDQIGGLMGRVNNTDANVGHYNYTEGTLQAENSMGVASGNYTLVYTDPSNGTAGQNYGLDITPRPITITANGDSTKVYGNADPLFTVGETAGTFVLSAATPLAPGDSFNSTTGVIGRVVGENVTTLGAVYAYTTQGSIALQNAGGATVTNDYTVTISNPNGDGLMVTPRPITLDATSPPTKTYNSDPYNSTATQFTVDGTLGANNDGLGFSDTTATLGVTALKGTAQGAVDVGTYSIIIPAFGATGGPTDANYTYTLNPGTLTVSKATLTVTANSVTIPYSNTTYATPADTDAQGDNNIIYTGIQANDTEAGLVSSVNAYTGSAEGAKNVAGSPYQIIPSINETAHGTMDYNVVYVNGALNITPIGLSITALNQSKTYDGVNYATSAPVQGTNVNVTGFAMGDSISSLGALGLSVTTPNINAGNYTITPSGAVDSNYTITYNTGTLAVAKRPLTIDPTSGTTKVYGNNDPTFGTTLFGAAAPTANTGLVNGDTLNAGDTITRQAGETVNGGTVYAFNGIGAGFGVSNGATSETNNYTISFAGNGDGLTITPRPILLDPVNQIKTYDSNAFNSTATQFVVDATLGANNAGLANNMTTGVVDTTTSLGVTALSGSAQGAVDAGIYTITIPAFGAMGGPTDPNYSYTLSTGSLTVNKATLTVTANSVTTPFTNVGYATPANTNAQADNNITYSGIQTHDTEAGLVSSVNAFTGTAEGAVNVAGSPYTIIPSINETAHGTTDYNVVYVNGALNITPIGLTITALNQTKTYNGMNYTTSAPVQGTNVNVVGLATGNTIASLGALSLAVTTPNINAGGTYTITPSGAVDSNYTISYVNGSLTVNQRPLTINPTTGTTKVYGNNDPSFGSTVFAPSAATANTGLVNGDTLNAGDAITRVAGETVNGGVVYAYNGLGAGFGVSNGATSETSNYSITFAGNGDGLTITPRPITLDATSQTKGYDGSAFHSTATQFTVDPTLGANNDGLANNAMTGVMDMNSTLGVSALGGTAQGAVNANTAANPTYSIIIPAFGTMGGPTDPNYTYTLNPGTLTVSPASLQVKVNSVVQNYNGNPYNIASSTSTVTGFVGMDTYANTVNTITYSGTASNAVNVVGSPYGIAAAATLFNANYTPVYTAGTLTINAIPLNIQAISQTKTYDGTAFASGAPVNGSNVNLVGLVSADTVSSLGALTLGGTAQGKINAGTYTNQIVPSGATDSNYIISYTDGTLNVNQRPIAITASAGTTKVYGDVDPTFGTGFYTVTPTGPGVGVAPGDTLNAGNALTRTPGEEVNAGNVYLFNGLNAGFGVNNGGTNENGNYAITFSDPGNYGLTITPRPLTIYPTSNLSKPYDNNPATDPTFNNYSETGLASFDTLAGVQGATGLTQNAGSYVFNQGSVLPQRSTAGVDGVGVNSDTSANYTITYQNPPGGMGSPYAFSITQAQLLVTVNNVTQTYNGSPYATPHTDNQGTGNVVITGFMNGETAATDITGISYSGNAQGAVNVSGSPYTIQAAVTETTMTEADYTTVYKFGNLTINPAPLTVTALPQSKVYDGVAFASGAPVQNGNVSVTGLVGTDSVSSLTGLALGGAAQGQVNVGTYTNQIVPGGSTDANYTTSYVNSTLTVTPRPITIIPSGQATKVYGNADPTFGSAYFTETPTGTGVGLAPGDSLNPTDVLTRTTGEEVQGGTVYSFTGTGPGFGISNGGTSETGNYTISYLNPSPSTFGLQITPRPLTIYPTSNLDKTYDNNTATDPAFTNYSATGLASFDSLGGLLSRTSSSQDAGTYVFTQGTVLPQRTSGTVDGVTPGTSTAGDYAITFANPQSGMGTPDAYTINQAPLVITVSSATKSYNGLAYNTPTTDAIGTGNVSYAGFVGGDSATSGVTGISYGGTAQGAVNVNTSVTPYSITAKATPTAKIAQDYSISYVPGTLTVNPVAATVTALNQTKTYDGAPFSSGTPTSSNTSVSGLVNGETVSNLTGLTLGGSAQGQVNAGVYTNGIAPGGTTDPNYVLTYVNGQLTVNPAPLTITANNQSKVYGGTDPNLTVSYTGLVSGDTISNLQLTTTTGSSATAGQHAITFLSGGTNPNYTITDTNGTLNVTPATLNIAANNDTVQYSGTPFNSSNSPSGTGNGVAITGLQYTDTAASTVSGSPTYSGSSQAAVHVSGSPYVITPGGYTALSSNYTINYVNGALTITPAPLTVQANNVSKVYGGKDPTLTATATGLLGTDTLSTVQDVSLTTATGPQATAGTHAISVTGATDPDYTITELPGTLTVAKAPLTLTANNQTKTYGGPDPTLTYTTGTLYYGDSPTVVSGAQLSTVTGPNATAGSHVISLTGGLASNYAITDVNGTLAVTPAQLILTPAPETKISGTLFQFKGTEFTANGLVYNDSVESASLSSPGAPIGAAPGSYFSLAAFPIAGVGLSNYDIIFDSGSFTVQEADDIPEIIGAPLLPFTPRVGFEQFSSEPFGSDYGDQLYYTLEVPGTITRQIPLDLSGIGIGSSEVHTSIGMETVYKVDRFQTYRH